MTSVEKTPLSNRIKRILAEHHQDGITPEDCLMCPSTCCRSAGFAILENVLLIYEGYTSGLLHRKDFEYERGLSFKDFVFKYFNVLRRVTGKWLWKRDVLMFHMKSISDEGHLIEVPEYGNFYDVRAAWYQANPWMSRGCGFLSQKVPNWTMDDGIAERHCILHDPQSNTHLTAKPIDCVFFTCDKPMSGRIPEWEISRRWFRALALDYPNSLQRFRALTEGNGEEGDSSGG